MPRHLSSDLTKSKRPRGRPKGTTKPAEEKVIAATVYYTPKQAAKVEAIKEKYGLTAWFQQQVNKTRVQDD